jgi:hypothetical protein
MKPTIIVCIALALLAGGSATAGAQALEVRPMVVLDGGPTGGVRLTSKISRERIEIGPFPRSWHIATLADLPFLLESERNSETLRARVDTGLLLSLFRPSTPVGALPSPDDPDPWNYGFVSAQVTVGAEAPQEVNTADMTVGGSVAYGHDQYHRLWFVPEGRVGWDAVFCVDCDPAPGDDDDTGSRLQVELGWSIPADREWMPVPLRPLWLRLRGRGFETRGLTGVAPLRSDDGLWGSAELAYRCDACGPVHEVYVRGHTGRLPLFLREERTVMGGVSLAF